ncbi:MAG: hypothetical protein KAI79_14445 [Bacteroidales bacterium]|nr:hypothetical protein [Bacteroidales bacterium]
MNNKESLEKLNNAISKGENFKKVTYRHFTFEVDNMEIGLRLDINSSYKAILTLELNKKVWYSEITENSSEIAYIMNKVHSKMEEERAYLRFIENGKFDIFWNNLK